MKYYIGSFLIIFLIIYFLNSMSFEGFTSNSTSIFSENDELEDITGESLCSIYASDLQELNNKCGELTEKNCNSTSCCLWLNGESCVTGNANGPTFRTTGGKNIDINYYSYKNKLVGK